MNGFSLAERLFPDINKTPEEIFDRYPKRQLKKDAAVTRMAPSPTGYMHLGNLYGAIIDELFARRTNGVFYLRIEDTDLERSVPQGIEKIIEVFTRFGLSFDEGVTLDGEIGSYGPYRQRLREEIYKIFAKALVVAGRAYPCFASKTELEDLRRLQMANNENPGYYVPYAPWRDKSEEQIYEKLDGGEEFVIRFRSNGNPGNKVSNNDLIRGVVEFPENNQDFVLLKSDGIPTYHFAHVVDDTLMGTTHVIRGEDWLPSLPWHLDLFKAMNDLFGWTPPKYVHTANLLKLDNGSKRKLSKRKDPELSLEYYYSEGFPELALIEYLMTIINSNFEEWRKKNPSLSYRDFPFSIERIASAGALFDMDKLRDVSKNIIAQMNAKEVYESLLAWAKCYDKSFHAVLVKDPKYAERILSIGRGGKQPRKDITVWSEACTYMNYFYDEYFKPVTLFPENILSADVVDILTEYAILYNDTDERDEWFSRVREISEKHGFAPSLKEYRANSHKYKGHVGDISMVLRVAITGRQNSPDLYEVMSILKNERVVARLNAAVSALESI